MSSHAAVQAALDAHAPLVAQVGARIWPDLAQEGAAYPLIVFKRTSLQRIKGLAGVTLGQIETFAIECWAHTRGESVALSELALDALDAAGLSAESAEPDGIDPELLDRVTVLSVEI